MSQSKYGPLEANGEIVQQLFYPSNGQPFYITVSECRSPFLGPEDRARNAKLFAAAHKLLEALEIARFWGYGQPPSCDEEEMVKSAIAEARGE